MQVGSCATFRENRGFIILEVGSFQNVAKYLTLIMPGSEEEEIILCYACGAPMNVSDIAPYSRVACPACKAENRVKTHFGPYTLTRRHAIGGMSSVFIGKDEALDREVALKILSEEYSKDEKRITAFEEEARLTASFSHPNVVRVLTTGKAFGRFYIAMEFVNGGHFEHQIREKGKVPEIEILPFAIQVAEGLKGAQAAGLIHRDIKPGNILLDSEGNAKIVDFGLALVTKGGKAKATEIWATPYYVPPEAIEGQAEDFRADIYAFGATLYHALAGKPSCNEDTMASNLLREAKKKVIPLKKVAPELTDETCAVIDRAMAYDPVNRFSSYDEMVSGLQSALKVARGEVVKDSDGNTKAERRAELRANNRKSIFLITSATAIAVAAIVTLILLTKADPTPSKRPTKILTVDSVDDTTEKSLREIATRYAAARNAMENGEYDKSGKIFHSLLKDENVEEPTRTWSGVQAVVSALMDGKMDLAKGYSATAEAHIASGPADLELGFVVGIMPVLRKDPEHGFFEINAMNLGPSGNQRFMGSFIAALKNWESGGIEQAVPIFEYVAHEASLTDDEVLGWYQKVAERYLADYRLLTSEAMSAQPKTVAECRELIEELNRKLTLLETRGRARFNIRARQIDYDKLESSLKKAPDPAPSNRPDVIAEIDSLAENYRFLEIVERVSKLEFDPPGYKRKSLLGISQSALIFLSEIESDLSGKPVVIDLKLKDGTDVSSIVIASGDRLVGKLASGEIRDLMWTEFSTDQLIELHRELVKAPGSGMERLRRHESAIAFEWLAGDRSRAVTAAGRLSAESAGFKTRWDSLASGLPE